MAVLPCECPPGVVSEILLRRWKLLAVDMKTNTECCSHRHAEDDIAYTWVHVVRKDISDDKERLDDFDGRMSQEISHPKGLVGAAD